MAKRVPPMQSGIFKQTAVRLCNDLFDGLGFAKRRDASAWIDIYAAVGNFAHECAGFTTLQEKKPLVQGSKGGTGFAQWTGYGKGGRRGLYEAWCRSKGLDPRSYEANLGYILVELRGPFRYVLGAVAKAKTPYDKMVAFEKGYEGAGIKHYDKRWTWMQEVKRLHLEWLAKQQPAPAARVGLLDMTQTGATDDPGASVEVAEEEEHDDPGSDMPEYEVKALQLRLIELGYGGMVGRANGDYGGRIHGTLAAFQKNVGIRPADGRYTEETKAALADDRNTMPLSAERLNTTAEQLAAAGSRTVQATQKTKRAAIMSYVGGTLAMVWGAVLQFGADAWGIVKQAKESFAEWPWEFIAPALFIAIVIYFHLKANDAQAAKVEDERLGVSSSIPTKQRVEQVLGEEVEEGR